MSVLGALSATAERPSLPARSLQGIARAHILVRVDDQSAARLAIQTAVANRVRHYAADVAPVPVDVIGFGDPALLQRDALGILVHVAIDRSGTDAQAVIAVRPYRAGAPGAALFGATPIAVRLGPDDHIPDAALDAALDQVLPWRMRAPGGPAPIQKLVSPGRE